MLALAFLNPLLLWAVPLCAVPIVIHLLNRRRFRTVPWAAMEFLLAAMKRNRKRLRMEQWLVLALRTLAVLLLVFLVCRPQLGGSGLLGGRTHHVVVLDDSASMAQKSGSTNLFEKAQDRIRALAEDLAAQRSGDLLSLLRTSRHQQPDLWAQRVGPELPRRVGALLKELAVGQGAPDLAAALQEAKRRAGEVKEASQTRFHLVGDLRAHDWATDDDKPRPPLLAALRAIAANDQLDVLGSGGPPSNIAVVDMRMLSRLPIVGLPATFAIDVQNLGLDPTPASTVAVEVDGQSRSTQPVPPLAPGERVAVPFAYTFHQAGAHRLDAALEPSETFPLDDRRTLALEVRDKSRVLLVDGQPDEELGETFYLQAAMEMAESGIEIQVVTDTALDETELSPFDLIWLCNLQAPSPTQQKRIEAFVAAGGGLVIAAGALIDTQRYNELLWRDGQGPLPLPFGEIAGDPDRPEKAALMAPEHPFCAGVAEVMDLLFGKVVLVKRWLTLTEPANHTAAIVARIRDAEGPALLATKTFGSGGEVAQFAITIDAFWSTLPRTDLFVVLVNQIHRAASKRADASAQNLLPDGAYRQGLDPATYRPDATVRAMTGDEERTFTAAEPAAGALPQLTVPMAELRHLGAYELELGRHDGASDKRVLARNPPPAEGRLVGFAPEAFARLYPAEVASRVRFVRDQGALADGTGEGELWPWLAAMLLAGLLLESLLAWRFGRR
jgi:hypothetical protein